MEVEPNQSNNEDDLGTEKKSARKVRLLQATVLTCYMPVILYINRINKFYIFPSITSTRVSW